MIVGLGNPGDEYKQTRHNAGFRVVDLLAETLGVDVRQKKFGARFGSVEYKDKKYKVSASYNTYGDFFIKWINYLSDNDMHHKDFEKAKELLK